MADVSKYQGKNQIHISNEKSDDAVHSISFLFIFAGIVGYESSALPLALDSTENDVKSSTPILSESKALETVKHGECHE